MYILDNGLSFLSKVARMIVVREIWYNQLQEIKQGVYCYE